MRVGRTGTGQTAVVAQVRYSKYTDAAISAECRSSHRRMHSCTPKIEMATSETAGDTTMPMIEYETSHTRSRSRREWLSTLALVGALLFAGVVGWMTRPWESEPETPFGMTGAAEGAPRPGELAPDFRLSRADGSALQLSELRGQPVFLNFWATWCTFCLEEMPDMQRISEEFDGQIVVLGVNAGDSVSSGTAFADRIGATYELVYDTQQQVVDGYRIRAMPSSYFIDADGRIVDAHLGFLTWDDMLDKVTALLQRGSIE